MGLSLPRAIALVMLLAFAATGIAQQSDQRKPRTKNKTDVGGSDAAKAVAKKAAAKRAVAKKAGAKNTTSRKPVTPTQIAQVDLFVKQHMPELSELLTVLKEAEPTRYATAIRELFVATDRLERLKPRDPEGYRMALKSWQLEKQLQLLAARIRMDDSMDAKKSELKRLLEERYKVGLQIMSRNRDRLAARLEKMDEEIANRKETHREDIDRLVRNWTRTKPSKTTAVSDRRAKKPAKNPAKKPVKKTGERGKPETKNKAGTNK